MRFYTKRTKQISATVWARNVGATQAMREFLRATEKEMVKTKKGNVKCLKPFSARWLVPKLTNIYFLVGVSYS
jgi:hypothetical protein